MDDGDDTSSDDTSSTETPSSEKLYQGSDVSMCGAYCLIMHFASRHKLSLSAIDDLLALLRVVCPEPNQLPSSLYKFRKYFNRFEAVSDKRVYCSQCHSPLPNSSTFCQGKSCHNTKEYSYMVQLSIVKPIETIVNSKYTY